MKKKRIFFLTIGLISSSILLFGCGEKEKIESFQKVEVLDGAIIEKDKEEFYNLNLKNQRYVKSSSKNIVIEDTLESQLIYDGGKYFVLRDKEKIPVQSREYINLNLSLNGSYLAYMIYEEGYNLKIIDLEKKTERKFNSEVRVSGTLFDFIDDDTLVYYGVSDENKNGIFKYDLKNEKEELLYEIKKGYVEFLKVIDEEIIFLQQNDEEKLLKNISKENGITKEISNKIVHINDIMKKGNEYVLLGSIKGNADSLYKINENQVVERLVYDFPKKINMKKGLSSLDGNRILFIGYGEGNNRENVYEYKDNEIILITEKDGIYEFVKKD